MTTRTAAARQHLERLLRVATCLAECGYGTEVGQLAATARAFRGDAQLWTAQARNRGPTGRTLLMHAALTGNVPRIQFLLERGADVEATSELGSTALMAACRQEKRYYEPLAVRMLVELGKANVNAVRSSDGRTALMNASCNGHVEMARFLVEHGATAANAATDDGMTALLGASHNGHLETVRFLVEYGGAFVNAGMSADGMTALISASWQGHLEIVRILIERGGANVNSATTDDGMTALMYASLDGFTEIVRFLVERGGAAVNAARFTDGMTALQWASQNGHLEIVRFLVERGGANVNAACTDDGLTALMLSCLNGHHEVARFLLQHGADKHALTHDGSSAFSLATSYPLVLAVLA